MIKSSMGYKRFNLGTYVISSLYLTRQCFFQIILSVSFKEQPHNLELLHHYTNLPQSSLPIQSRLDFSFFMATDLKIFRPMPKPFILLISMFAYFHLGTRGEEVISMKLSDKRINQSVCIKGLRFFGRTPSQVFHICSYKQIDTSLPHSLFLSLDIQSLLLIRIVMLAFMEAVDRNSTAIATKSHQHWFFKH